ncbi:MAG: helix-turn-helix domain-containing protein [Clostridium sp.]
MSINKFTTRLKSLRELKKLTQEEIADKLNVSRTTYANWETGRAEPGLEMIISLANVFGVSIDYLCGVTNVRDRIYDDPKLCEYINKCVGIYDEFFKDQDK